MNDDKQVNAGPMQPPPRTPNREYRRTPPVIEGEASLVNDQGGDENQGGSGVAQDEAAPAPDRQVDNPTLHETRDAAPAEAIAGPAASEGTASRGPGFGALSAACLASAGLAALAVFGVQTLNAPSGPSPATLDARIGEVERRVAAVQASQTPSAGIAALEQRVARVETLAATAADAARKAADVAARPAAADGGALKALDSRIAALEKNTAGAASRLADRVTAVEKTLAAPKASDRATETSIEPAGPTLALEPLRKQIAALEGRLQNLERQTAPLADAARAADARVRSLEERVQPLAGRLDETRAQGDAERKRAQALADRSAQTARLALAQSLATAVASGTPFAAQVDALARLGVPTERLAKLVEISKTGAPTADDLARALAALRSEIVVRPEAPADASMLDRLTSSALGLVRVRPTGETKGAAPPDVFARMIQALQRDDIAAALKEREALPDRAKAASADWAIRAQARLDAEQAARALLADETQKLGRT